MKKRDIVVIGASAGGVAALMDLVATLPKDFDAAIFVVQHVAPFTKSLMPEILSKKGPLNAVHPKDGEKIKTGKIYIAPPDHHLLIEKDRMLVKKGPKENRFRPSIDALFRSAAYNYGSRVIGVVLSGLLDDGTSGMWSIKRFNGIGIIQSPEDAMCPSMPENVLEFVDVDHIVTVSEMGNLLTKLVQETAPGSEALTPEKDELMLTEIKISAQDNAFKMDILNKGELTPLTCPECNGTLVKISEGKLVRYRCHTGHGFTDSSLLSEVTKTVEENLWKVMRSLEESIVILEQNATRLLERGEKKAAEEYISKANEMRKRAKKVRSIVFEQEQLSFDEELIHTKSKKAG